MPLISVVSPVYKAEACVSELCRRIKSSLETITSDYELILVDDRSPDKSWEMIQEESKNDSRVIGIRLAKNFGQHRAITAGLDKTSGDWVVVMDCDLQDPPEVIPELYQKALEGYEIVVAKFEARLESGLRQYTSRIFWSILSWLAGIHFDYKVGNYRIMSKRVVENFRCYREQLRYLGGIINLMGFTSTTLSVKREERFAGETSYSLKRLVGIAVDIVMAYSDKPLRIAIVVGLLMAGISFAVGTIVLLLWISGVVVVPGWASVMVSLYFIAGLIIVILGIMGYYLGKIFDETKQRPLYIIENITSSLSEKAASDSRLEGNVFWITGLSGAGKTTLCMNLVKYLKERGHPVIMLDGDDLREVLGVNSAHGKDDRLQLAMRYARLCRTLASQGINVAIATISMFHAVQEWNRNNLPGYMEIFLDVPLHELIRRDSKQLYARAAKGEVNNVAGLDFEVDKPISPDIHILWQPDFSVENIMSEIVKQLNTRKQKGR